MKILKIATISLINITFCIAFANNSNKFISDQLIVKLKNKSPLKSKGIISKKKLYDNLYLISSKNIAALEKELRKNKNIEYVQKNFIHEKETIIHPPKNFNDKKTTISKKSFISSNSYFNDNKSSGQWYLKSLSQKGISVSSAYANNLVADQKDVIVAVVDTGVDFNHPDLENQLWTNQNEIEGNGIDDDNNGYVDDIHGISTVNRNKQGEATNDIMDESIHGTHVAGIIAAEQNNNIGIAGISKNSKIMVIKTIPAKGDETDADVIESFVYAARNSAKIINCSFGKSKKSMAVADIVKDLSKKFDLLFIVAAGNKGKNLSKKPVYPAAFSLENMIIVGSTNSVEQKSYFSNYNRNLVDVFAPGTLILSTIPGNKYKSLKGTSMAAPVVSGLAAEIKAQNPELKSDQIKKIILSTVTRKSSLKRKSVSGGIINFKNALIKARK